MSQLPLNLPPSRPTQLTAEICVGVTGSVEWYLLYDGDMCVRQSCSRNVEEAQAYIRDSFKIEPKVIQRKPVLTAKQKREAKASK